MSHAEAKLWIARIEDAKGDDEVAHGLEDEMLWAYVEAQAADGDEVAEVLMTREFREVTPRAVIAENGLDQLVGLAFHDGLLHALWQDSYDVDGQDGGRKSLANEYGLYQVGGGNLKAHAGYLTSHDGLLWCGRSDGAGNANVRHGPSLWRVGPSLRAFWAGPPERPDWTPADRYTALAFLPGHVCWLVQKAVGPVWYGTRFGPAGEVDPWNRDKGYHTTAREVWLMPYTWPGKVEHPPIALGEFHESARCGGMAYDPGSSTLYVHELAPHEKQGNVYPWERPIIHRYEVIPEDEDEDEGEPPPPPEYTPQKARVTVEFEGVKFSGEITEEP